MNIKWHGQACFSVTGQNGVSIVMDPYNNFLGYKLPELTAHIVTTSHNHNDHNNVKAIKGDFKHFNSAGVFNHKGVEIKGVLTYHDKQGGAIKGENIIYNFHLDGLNICHCGDLGHLLDSRQINEIGKVDILLLPVGGMITLNAAEAVTVLGQLNPSVIIPMHYRTKALGISGIIFGTVDKFIITINLNVSYYRDLEITTENINNFKGIAVLDYK